MSIVYSWVIEQMNCYPEEAGQTDVVFSVFWRLNGTDGTYNGTINGSVNVTYVSGSPFTPYNDLTEQQVLGWVQASYTPEELASFENNIAQQIQTQINPPIVSPPLPWA